MKRKLLLVAIFWSALIFLGAVTARLCQRVPNPTSSPGAGTYSSTQNVSLADTYTGSTLYICYTTDGTTVPWYNGSTCGAGTHYTTNISVAATTTVKYIACATNYSCSSVVSELYTIAPAGIAFDVAGAGNAATGTTLTAAHTVTNGKANSAVVAIVGWAGGEGNATITGCTYNGNTMTAMWNHRETVLNQYGSAGFVYANGTGSGVSHDVVCTLGFTSSSGASLLTTSWSGVNQTTPARTAATPLDFDSTNNSPAVQVTVSNAVSGDMVVDGISLGSSVLSTSSQTSRATAVNYLGSSFSNQTSSAAATGATAMGYTVRTSETIGSLNAAALIPQ